MVIRSYIRALFVSLLICDRQTSNMTVNYSVITVSGNYCEANLHPYSGRTQVGVQLDGVSDRAVDSLLLPTSPTHLNNKVLF